LPDKDEEFLKDFNFSRRLDVMKRKFHEIKATKDYIKFNDLLKEINDLDEDVTNSYSYSVAAEASLKKDIEFRKALIDAKDDPNKGEELLNALGLTDPQYKVIKKYLKETIESKLEQDRRYM
jgi:hypothetical protein